MKIYQKTIIALLGLIIFVSLSVNIRFAQADAAPPPAPVGSDLSPSIENTNVRMVSEYVLIDIVGYPTAITSYGNRPIEHANVTAHFSMQNLGDVTEKMRVRFPMNHSDYDLEYEKMNKAEYCEYSPYPSLNEINVWVNGNKVDTEITFKTMEDHMASPNEKGEAVYKTVPCWAYFDATFPPNQEVKIKVAYTVSGYDFHGIGGEIEFQYVLGTGAGWKDTIGKAEIVARLPYDTGELNVSRCLPKDCVISGKEISWYFEDFEPQENIVLWIIHPTIWQRILAERENIRNQPNDGEAWGRLGKAYKEAQLDGKRMLSTFDEHGKKLFALSYEAYARAIELLPEDADWHYGFADLLCTRALWDEDTNENWMACAKMLMTCLQLEPEHKQGNELLNTIVSLQGNRHLMKDIVIVDVSGPEPNFLILTPGNYPLTTPSLLATETSRPIPTKTKSIIPSSTSPEQPLSQGDSVTIAVSPESTPTLEISKTEADVHTASDNQFPSGIIVVGSILCLAVIIIVVYRRTS